MILVFDNYQEKDFVDLREMIFALYAEDPSGSEMTDEKIENTVREIAAHTEKARIMMIRTEGENIGYSIIVMFWSNERGGDIIHIDELYVKKEYRNKRAASSFIEWLIESYTNAVAFALETTPSNSAASRLYHRLGFEPTINSHWIKVTQAASNKQGL